MLNYLSKVLIFVSIFVFSFLFAFQHALLLPVLAHHVRYHLSLQSFDEKIDYVFKDRSLLQVGSSPFHEVSNSFHLRNGPLTF